MKGSSVYKEKMPRIKEKLIAMLLLLVLSASMLTAVSFAWVSLSTKPEASGITTSIAANGNLEIALASGTTITVPGASQIGDANLTIADRNITWGNLINLSDASYGLSNMVLRPALLYEADLLNSPLRAAIYSADGRVNGMDSAFRYAKWTIYDDRDPEFVLTDQYGLRAITSTIMSGDMTGFNKDQLEYLETMDKANGAAVDAYLTIVKNESYMNSLVTLMGHYMTARMNDDASINNPSFDVADAENLRDTFGAFVDALEAEQAYMLAAANYQIFLQATYNENASWDISLEKLLTGVAGASKNSLTSVNTGVTGSNGQEIVVKLYGLASNIYDLNIIREGYEQLKTLCANGGPYTWKESGINNILNRLVNVGDCEVYNPETGTVKISSMGASAALGYLGKNNNEAIITNGVLFNYEQRTGADMTLSDYTADRTIKVTVKRYGITMRDQKVTASLKTSAQITGYPTDRKLVEDLLPDAQKNANAGSMQLRADATYGYVIDFWIRTNALGSYLNLEGNVLTRDETVDVKGKDPDGNEVQLYTVTETIEGEEDTITRDVYIKEVVRGDPITDASGNIVRFEENPNGTHKIEIWYYHDTGSQYSAFRMMDATVENASGTWYEGVPAADGSDTIVFQAVADMVEPKKKVEIHQIVIGYEGENRVWDEDDSALIEAGSTTQGSGSCYVFYADTAEDMEKGLDLLSALRVAFVSSDGKLLTEASLDTEHFYSDAGKVIVPLVLSSDQVVKNEETGEVYNVITKLERNEATLISAIVYLNGYQVTNEDVLAASDIEGQFNLQFGNTIVDVNLDPMPNEKLESEKLIFSAGVDKTTFNYETDDDLTVHVNANIEGVTPKSVEAFFVRTITSTQGVKLETFSFTGSGDTWTGQFTFTSPGEYILRSLRIDGIEYDLPVASRPKVTVEGFSIQELNWDETSNFHRFMTSSGSISTGLSVKIGATPAKRPSSVSARFHNAADNTNTYATLHYDPTADKWEGTVTFNTSGEYVLDMLTIDGNQTAVDTNLQKTAEVICGMKVAVYTTSPQLPKRIVLEEGVSTDDELNLKMQVKLLDNKGNFIDAVSDVHLYYGRKNWVSDEVGMHAPMVWNSATGYYEGILQAQEGDYEFLRVTVGTSEISNATTSPAFSIMEVKVPKLLQAASKPYQFGSASFQVQMDAPDSSVIQAVIVDGNGKEIIVDQSGKTGNMWGFELMESGTFYIKELRLKGCYNANGDFLDPDGEEYYTISVNTDEAAAAGTYRDGTIVRVVKEFNVEVATPDQTIEGGAFLAAQTWKNTVTITPDITDANVAISDVKLTFKYDKTNMQAYGGYSTDNLAGLLQAVTGSEIGDEFTITLTENADGTFAIDRTLTYAGDYKLTKVEFTVAMDGTSKTVTMEPDNSGKFTTEMGQDLSMLVKVKSEKPTVKITGVSPTSTTVNSGDNELSATNAVFNNGFSVVAYITGTKEWALVPYWNYSTPTISLEIQNASDITSATFTLINATNASYNNVVTFDSTKATTTKVGHVISGTGGGTKYTINKQTISQITVVKNGITFTAILSDMLSFEQPEKPSTLTYAGILESYTGARPAMVVANGTRFVLTLPTISWTANIEEPVGDEPVYSDYVNPVTLRTDYTEQKSSSWGQTWWKYYLYNWCRYTATAIAEADIYAQEYIISSWSINGTTYAAGEEIVIDSETDIIAIAIVEKGEKTYVDTKETPMYKYKYGYERVGEGDKPTSSDSKKIGDTTTVGTSWSVPQWKEYPPALGPLYDSDAEYEKAWP